MRAEVVEKRAGEIVDAMPDLHPDLAKFQAEREEDIARLLAAHRAIADPSRPGMMCVNPECWEVSMQNMMDAYRHQASKVWEDGP